MISLLQFAGICGVSQELQKGIDPCIFKDHVFFDFVSGC